MVALTDLARRYGDLYVPACRVTVGGRELVRDLQIPYVQVEVDLVTGAPGRFSFTIVDCYDIEQHAFISGLGMPVLDLLRFGAPVQISMGYGDASGLTPLLTGTITEIGTSFPESGYPELSIAGYDKGFPLTLGKNSHSWQQQADSEIVAEIARGHGLDSDIDTTIEKHAKTEQNQESDMDFIKKLAERNNYIFYVRDTVLTFRKPRDRLAAAVSMKWGAGLLSFKPEANLAGQVGGVEVHGWDPIKKEAIVGKANAGEETGRTASGQSAADLLGGTPGGGRPIQRLRQPVFTQAEADTRAKAALNERATKFLTGDGECFGLPEIVPDTTIQLDNLGKPFSTTYYVTEATHKLDGSGYRTRFKVRETVLG